MASALLLIVGTNCFALFIKHQKFSIALQVKNDSELRRKSEYAAVTPDAHSKLPKEPVIQEDTQTGIVAGSTIWEKFQHLGNYYSGRDEVEKDPARRVFKNINFIF